MSSYSDVAILHTCIIMMQNIAIKSMVGSSFNLQRS